MCVRSQNQTNSPSSMRNSSKPAGTTNPCWRHPCRIRRSLNTDDLANPRTDSHRKPQWAILQGSYRTIPSATLAPVHKVCLSTLCCDMNRSQSHNSDSPSQPTGTPYYNPDQPQLQPTTSHSPDPRMHTPPAAAPYQQAAPAEPYQPVYHRPESTYDHPQELGTSVYDSPVDHHPPATTAATQRAPYPAGGPPPFPPQQQPAGYGPDDPATPGQAPYPAPPASQPPPVPGTASTPAPYQGYQAYKPGGMAGSNPASYYR